MSARFHAKPSISFGAALAILPHFSLQWNPMATNWKKSLFVPQTILWILLIISAFFLGSLYTKVQYLEKGQGAPSPEKVGAASKYKSFDDAMKALGKDTKLDANKLSSCISSGEKKAIVDADISQGNSLGITGTPAFFINGKLLGGAFPFESFKEIIDKELAGKGSTNPADYSQSLQEAAKSGAFDPVPKKLEIGSNANMRGKEGAQVTVVEFSDFQCPYCAKAYPTVNQVEQTYGDKVVFYYKHFPLVSIHPRAEKTAEASECARDQGKFWEFHDKLFQNQPDWSSL